MPGIWRKTLIYLGLVEDEDLDDYGYDDFADEEPMQPPSRRNNLRRVSEVEPQGRRDAVVRPIPTAAPAAQQLHLVHPTNFNDAQEVGDKFRQGNSVIMNLQATDPEMARRLIDFASGLVYGLGGGMQPVAEKVFILTPPGINVSAEERRRFLEESGFFNQA